MPKNRISPHDRYIRSMMSHPKVIQEFFEANLPENVKKAIDFKSIALQKDSFIDDKLRLQIADLLYAVNFDGKPGYIYLLLEHASQPDPLLPFRMLKYMVAIMDHHLKKTATKELPVIYPQILYTGSRAFSHSMDLFDLFGTQKTLAREILKNPYHLIDLTQASDEDLQKYLWFGSTALAAKHIYDSDIIPFLKGFLKLLKVIEKTGETGYIYTVISYIIEAGQVSDKDEFIKTLTTELESTNEEKIMKIIDQLKPELYNKWKREMALNLLKLKVSIKKISEATGLSIQDIQSLKIQIH
jgi:predicted transposase/invertase (TIGR01784 family)